MNNVDILTNHEVVNILVTESTDVHASTANTHDNSINKGEEIKSSNESNDSIAKTNILTKRVIGVTIKDKSNSHTISLSNQSKSTEPVIEKDDSEPLLFKPQYDTRHENNVIQVYAKRGIVLATGVIT